MSDMPNIPRERAKRKLFSNVSNTSDKASKVKTDSRLFVSTIRKGCPCCVVTQGHNRLFPVCDCMHTASRPDDAAQTFSKNLEKTFACLTGWDLFFFRFCGFCCWLLFLDNLHQGFLSLLSSGGMIMSGSLNFSVLLTTGSYGLCPERVCYRLLRLRVGRFRSLPPPPPPRQPPNTTITLIKQ